MSQENATSSDVTENVDQACQLFTGIFQLNHGPNYCRTFKKLSLKKSRYLSEITCRKHSNL